MDNFFTLVLVEISYIFNSIETRKCQCPDVHLKVPATSCDGLCYRCSLPCYTVLTFCCFERKKKKDKESDESETETIVETLYSCFERQLFWNSENRIVSFQSKILDTPFSFPFPQRISKLKMTEEEETDKKEKKKKKKKKMKQVFG